jgi:hypothetical protein
MVEAVEAARLQAVGVDLIPFAIVRSTGSNGDRLLQEGADLSDEAVVDIGAGVAASACILTAIPGSSGWWRGAAATSPLPSPVRSAWARPTPNS